MEQGDEYIQRGTRTKYFLFTCIFTLRRSWHFFIAIMARSYEEGVHRFRGTKKSVVSQIDEFLNFQKM